MTTKYCTVDRNQPYWLVTMALVLQWSSGSPSVVFATKNFQNRASAVWTQCAADCRDFPRRGATTSRADASGISAQADQLRPNILSGLAQGMRAVPEINPTKSVLGIL